MKPQRRPSLLGPRTISRLRYRRLTRMLAEDGERLATEADLRGMRVG